MTIIRNRCKCALCGDVIESKHRHDFVTCKCGAISVDGGKDYLKRSGNWEDIIEMSEEVEDEQTKRTDGRESDGVDMQES